MNLYRYSLISVLLLISVTMFGQNIGSTNSTITVKGKFAVIKADTLLALPEFLFAFKGDTAVKYRTDSLFAHAIGGTGVSVVSFEKNVTKDSIILLLSNGDRFAAKDSVGVGGSSGIQSVTGNIVDNTDPNNPVVNGISQSDLDDSAAAIRNDFPTLTETDPIATAKTVNITGSSDVGVTGGMQIIGNNPAFTLGNVIGIRGAAVPSLTTGLLKYNGSAWVFDNSTYLTSFSETDPLFDTKFAAKVAGGDLSGIYPNPSVAWANGYPIYDARYLTSFTEVDPVYLLNGVPKTRTLTINGTTLDLSANRSWTISTGSSSFASLSDVNLTSIANGQLVKYNSSSGKWENFTPTYISSYTETDPLSVHITDTAAMLSPYLRSNIAAATYVPLTRTLTINGTTLDLSANRSWTISTGGTPAGNYGNLQLNRNGAFDTPASDSLSFNSGTFTNKGATRINAGNGTPGVDSPIVKNNGVLMAIPPGYYTDVLSGVANQITYFSGAHTVTSSSNFKVDATNGFFSIGGSTPVSVLDIYPAFPGTISVTNGSATVTGTGTLFTSNFKKGDTIRVSNTTNAIVSVIQNDFSLTLSANYAGTTNASATYTNKSSAAGLLRVKGNQRLYSGGYQLASWGGSYNNTFFGLNAAGRDTTGDRNTGFGAYVLVNSTGNENTAVGNSALTANTTGGSNTAVGNLALTSNTTGANNTAVGKNASYAATTGSNNVGIGASALQSNNGSNNIGIGTTAGSNATSSNGVYIGAGAGLASTGTDNVAIGYNALFGSSSGGNNVAIGSGALLKNTTGTFNVGIGYSALDSNLTGVGNVNIGWSNGFRIRGSYNVGIGYATQSNYLTGDNNIAIGRFRTNLWNASNSANIGGSIFITGMTNPTSQDSVANTSGLVGINTISPVSNLDVAGSFGTAYVAKTSTYTIATIDNTIDCTSGTFTVTLPTAIGITGRIYTIVNSGSGTITIATTGSQAFTNITSAPTSLTLAPVGAGAITSYTVKATGAAWVVIGKVKNE